MKFGHRLSVQLALFAALSGLAGCAATSVALGKKDLDVQTKTSTSVFVEPVVAPERTLYLDVRSGVAEFDRRAFSRFVREQFSSGEAGYRLTDDPAQAHFHMLVYVLSLEKASPDAAQAALQQGYVGGGEVVAGAVAGGVIGRNSNSRVGRYDGAAIGGLAAATGSLVANSLVHDVTYMLVCDVSIREKAGKGVLVRKDTSIDAKVSDGGSSQQRYSEASDRKEYRTRIVTTANKANLDLKEAQDPMFNKTAFAMAGFF